MPKAEAELVVITKTYDLVLWSLNHIVKFPRSFRFTFGERLEMRLYRVLEMLVEARYRPDRRGLLERVNLELELLRFQFRIAKDLKCLSLEAIAGCSRRGGALGP